MKKLFILILISLVYSSSCYADGEKQAVELYLNFIKSLNESKQLYLKVRSYMIYENGESTEPLITETWKASDAFRIKSSAFDQFIDTSLQVNIILRESKIIISESAMINDQQRSIQKKNFNQLDYEQLKKEAEIAFENNQLIITYSTEYQELYGLHNVKVLLEENKVREVSVIRPFDGRMQTEVTQYLVTNFNSSKTPFDGTALQQLQQARKSGQYQDYEIINLTNQTIQ